jgi:hypothetical protein
MAKQLTWERNIWTGNDIARINDNTRVVRMPADYGKSYLYCAEFWGDYSLAYPIRSGWYPTLAKAKSSLKSKTA